MVFSAICKNTNISIAKLTTAITWLELCARSENWILGLLFRVDSKYALDFKC